MSTRNFHIGDILSVTTGRLVSLNHIDGLYEILSFMTGEQVFTHVIPRATQACAPELLRQHPQLQGALWRTDISGQAEVFAWVAEQAAAYGEQLPVMALPAGAWESRDPIAEMIEGRRRD